MLEHEENECMKRPYKCDTCHEFESTYEGVTTEHISVCPCGLVPCPNDCGVVEIQRQSVADHLATLCPLELVSCLFSYAGCEEKLPRKDMAAHISDSLAVHMSLQAIKHVVELNELKTTHQNELNHLKFSYQKELNEQKTAHLNELKELKTELKELLKNSHRNELTEVNSQVRELHTHMWIMPVNIKLDGFAAKKAEGKPWSSHLFYTHPRGYKLALSVYCNGDRERARSHISAYVYLKSGEYDNELTWPFRRSVTIRLVDQKEGMNHHNHTLDFGNAPERCTKRRVVGDYAGWGTPRFISHSKLSPNYLVNDSLCFSVF